MLVLVLIPLCTVLRLVSPGNVYNCPCSYSYLLYSNSLGQHGQWTYLPAFILMLCVNRCTVCTVLVSLIQCFAWTARAMYLLARGRTRTGVRTGNVPTCPCLYSYWYLLCSTLLDSTGNVPTCPCSYSYWYLLCSASLGQHGQCTYFPVVVLVLVSAWVMYLLARVRTRTGTSCAVLRLDSTGNVPSCP